MQYEIKIRRLTGTYSGDMIAEATINLPDYPGIEARQADAVTIVAGGTVATFAESMSKAATYLGRAARLAAEQPVGGPGEPEPKPDVANEPEPEGANEPEHDPALALVSDE